MARKPIAENQVSLELNQDGEFEDTFSSSASGDEGVEETQEESMEQDYSYKDGKYWALPEHVRNAIDIARAKTKHSDFYGSLRALNDKIKVYRLVFYGKDTNYDRTYLRQKRRRFEQQMLTEKQEIENLLLKKKFHRNLSKKMHTHIEKANLNAIINRGSTRDLLGPG